MLKTFWQMEKLFVLINFSFGHKVFKCRTQKRRRKTYYMLEMVLRLNCVGLVLSRWCSRRASATGAGGRWFDPLPGHTKYFTGCGVIIMTDLSDVRINGPVVLVVI